MNRIQQKGNTWFKTPDTGSRLLIVENKTHRFRNLHVSTMSTQPNNLRKALIFFYLKKDNISLYSGILSLLSVKLLVYQLRAIAIIKKYHYNVHPWRNKFSSFSLQFYLNFFSAWFIKCHFWNGFRDRNNLEGGKQNCLIQGVKISSNFGAKTYDFLRRIKVEKGFILIFLHSSV